MAYEVTATLRRPQVFDALAGQSFVSKALKSSIESGKIAHAYLFAGPRGCGKTSTARILAKALNCDKGPTAAPCGECAHCKEITAGSSLDVIEIDGASNTSVNDVRQIKDEVMFPPNSSRYKIYIIDEVHMLSTSAFNALLKTIEEPPPHVVFIFATTETQKVPATIKSRCQQFNFRLVAVDEVKALLAAAAKDSGVEAEDEALYWIARQGAGSVRDAYTLFDQVASFSEGHITYDKIRSHLGLVGIDRLNEIFAHCAKGEAKEALEAVDAALSDGVSVEQLVSDAASYVRSVLLIQNGVEKASLLGEAKGRYSEEVLRAWGADKAERSLSLVLQLFRDLRYSLSPRYEVELAISRLSWLSQYVSPREVKAAIDAIRPLLGGISNIDGRATRAPETRGTYASQAPLVATQPPSQLAGNKAAGNPPPPRPCPEGQQTGVASPVAPEAGAAAAKPHASEPMPLGMPMFSALKEQGQGAQLVATQPPSQLAGNKAGGGSHPFVSGGVSAASAIASNKDEETPAQNGGASGGLLDADDLPLEVRILRDTFRGTVTKLS